MEPLLTKAAGEDNSLKSGVFSIIRDKRRFQSQKEQQKAEVLLDEVEQCMQQAQKHFPLFRKRSKVGDLCLQLARNF